MKNYSYLCNLFGHLGLKTERSFAPVAELVDAPDLGSGVFDVQVRVLSGAQSKKMGKNGCQAYHKHAILIENCSF